MTRNYLTDVNAIKNWFIGFNLRYFTDRVSSRSGGKRELNLGDILFLKSKIDFMDQVDSSNPLRLIGRYFIEVPETHSAIIKLLNVIPVPYEFNPTLSSDNRMILVDTSGKAIFIWEKSNNKTQPGVECIFFWNNSLVKSSVLIKDASYLGLLKWSKCRQFTRTHPTKSRSKVSEYYAFKLAGWKKEGKTELSDILEFNY